MSQASPVYQGSCLCQGIRYEIKGDIGDIIQCHCQRCRKSMEQHLQRMLLSTVQILKLRKVKTLSKICCEWCVPLVL